MARLLRVPESEAAAVCDGVPDSWKFPSLSLNLKAT